MQLTIITSRSVCWLISVKRLVHNIKYNIWQTKVANPQNSKVAPIDQPPIIIGQYLFSL